MTREDAIRAASEYAYQERFSQGSAWVYVIPGGEYGWIEASEMLPDDAYFDVEVQWNRIFRKAAGSRSIHTPAGQRSGAPPLG